MKSAVNQLVMTSRSIRDVRRFILETHADVRWGSQYFMIGVGTAELKLPPTLFRIIDSKSTGIFYPSNDPDDPPARM